MPFKSKAQAHYLYAKEPQVAKEFSQKTNSIKSLPPRVMQLEAIKKNSNKK